MPGNCWAQWAARRFDGYNSIKNRQRNTDTVFRCLFFVQKAGIVYQVREFMVRNWAAVGGVGIHAAVHVYVGEKDAPNQNRIKRGVDKFLSKFVDSVGKGERYRCHRKTSQ